LEETKLENIVLRDPNSRPNRLHRLQLSGTVGTSGHFNVHTGISLRSCIRILSQDDLSTSTTQCLGSGWFGTCFLQSLGHYSVCVKVFKRPNNNARIHEANILSRFTLQCLPYLFGVCIGDHPSIVTSFHGINGHSVTLHHALFARSQEVEDLLVDVHWMEVLKQIYCGLEHLHDTNFFIMT